MNRTVIIIMVALSVLAAMLLACIVVGATFWQMLDHDDSAPEEDFMETLDAIEQQVVDLRGLDPKQDVPRILLTEEELRQRMMADFEEDYTPQEVRHDVLTLAAFGFVEPDLDLYNLFVDLYTEQVAGFYDTDEQTIYVVSRGAKPGASDRTTFAHEFNHALQDQHFDLDRYGVTDDEEVKKTLDLDSEAEWAGLALIEGDAVLVQTQHMLTYFDQNDWEEMFAEFEEMDMSVMDSAPLIIQETLMFPYDEGAVFVEHLYQQGGWPAVNAAFAQPPVSTEQILHPERYPEDIPQVVSLPPLTDTLGNGWHQVDEDILGEFQLGLYLALHEPQQTASQAAAGWDGDRYAVYWNGDETDYVLVMKNVWDDESEADEFVQTYTQFATDRHGQEPTQPQDNQHRWSLDGQETTLLIKNQSLETLVILAPNQTTLQAVYELFPEF